MGRAFWSRAWVRKRLTLKIDSFIPPVLAVGMKYDNSTASHVDKSLCHAVCATFEMKMTV